MAANAENEAEYIEIAVRLGQDEAWRKQLRSQILQTHDRLFEDRDCVTALEAVYRSWVSAT